MFGRIGRSLEDLLQNAARRIGFTPTESKVVLFFVGMFLVGIAVRVLRGDAVPAPVDYAEEDSVFFARSAAPDPADPRAERRLPAPNRDSGAGRSAGGSPVRIIDINRATQDDLVALPGIGPSLAARILAYRHDHGPFRSPQDLAKVKGIGSKKMSRLLPYCTIGE